MKRALAALGFLLSGCLSAVAGSMTLLGAGSAGAAAPPPSTCSGFMPAAFNTSALYINWTTADGLGSFGMACLNGTTAVAASTLGTISGSGSVGASGLVLTGGFFQFSNVTWLAQNSGTIYVNMLTTSVSGGHTLFTISDGTTANDELMTATGSSIRGSSVIASATTTVVSGFTATVNVPFKAALSYTAGTQIIYVNGTTTATSSAASIAPSLTASNIGANAVGTTATPSTHTEEAYFSTALNAGTSPTLQAITQ